MHKAMQVSISAAEFDMCRTLVLVLA